MARNGIMPALDSTRKMYNPITGSNIAIPENVLWIAAINNGTQFTGTTTIDPAQLDRFAPLCIRYLPAEQEVRLLAKRYPQVQHQRIERVVKAANLVRNNRDLAVDLSMRATDEICALLSHPNFADFKGDAIPELYKTSFCGRFLGRWDDEASDAGLVWKLLAKA